MKTPRQAKNIAIRAANAAGRAAHVATREVVLRELTKPRKGTKPRRPALPSLEAGPFEADTLPQALDLALRFRDLTGYKDDSVRSILKDDERLRGRGDVAKQQGLLRSVRSNLELYGVPLRPLKGP